jgi:PIN domain nuclease of toxin-antitoxin system
MILLDTHIWIWWVNGEHNKLPAHIWHFLNKMPKKDIYISIISCWELAKLVEKQRISLSISVTEWLEEATEKLGITVIPLEMEIIIEACQLPQPFHQDPMDQLIVATSRVKNLDLLTLDGKITAYPFVNIFS